MGFFTDGAPEKLGSQSRFVARIKQGRPNAVKTPALSTTRLLPQGLYLLQ